MNMSAPKFYLYNHQMVSLSLFLLLLVSQFFNPAQSQDFPDLCHPHDKQVLLRIKNQLGNPSSLVSWDTKTDCCGVWNNIQCNEQGHVISVGITQANDIHAPFPKFFDDLPSLTQLYFQSVPGLSGPIPSYIGKLTNLTVFMTLDTNIAGPIPDFLGRLTKLTQLDLSSNKFTGPIPDFLSKMKSLTYLDLHSNRLTGPIPQALAQLTDLSFLRLGSNKLSGKIPDFLTQRLRNLNTIDLESNNLSGLIPESLGQQPNLTGLDLSGNQFTGPIPKSFGRSNVAILKLSQNKLIGDASFLFDKANTAILDIHVDNNLLKFDFSNVDLAENLQGFNVSHNLIYGSLPKRFGQMRVDSVDVSYNQLCGPIPNGRRFKRVGPIIFFNNKCLCGGPLHACK